MDDLEPCLQAWVNALDQLEQRLTKVMEALDRLTVYMEPLCRPQVSTSQAVPVSHTSFGDAPREPRIFNKR